MGNLPLSRLLPLKDFDGLIASPRRDAKPQFVIARASCVLPSAELDGGADGDRADQRGKRRVIGLGDGGQELAQPLELRLLVARAEQGTSQRRQRIEELSASMAGVPIAP
jgi:hypothetical protein